MPLGGFIILYFITIEGWWFLRELERGKRLDTNTLETKFFKPISCLTKLFNTFTLLFRRVSSDLNIDQHDKVKWLQLEN